MRTLPWDWHDGTIPEGVQVDPTAYVETSYSFDAYRSRRSPGVVYGPGSATYLGTMFDVGPNGRVTLGRCAMVHGARIVCDGAIDIGDYSLISWNVVLMDTRRMPGHPQARRAELRALAGRERRWLAPDPDPRPVRVGANTWLGFDVCVLPGVSIGEGSIIGARSVVASDVPPFVVAAGNPARVIRQIDREEVRHDAA